MATNDRDAARIGLLEDLLAAKTPLAPIAAGLAIETPLAHGSAQSVVHM